jgi:Protein of unknown function (DUF1353)
MTLPRAIFPDPLRVEMLHMAGGRRLWTLAHRFRAVTSLGVIDVPSGFITDLASTPRFLWAAFSPSDEFLPAAIPHDWLYSPFNRAITRKQADDIMLELMHHLGIPWPRRHAIHSALRLFGRAGWESPAPYK